MFLADTRHRLLSCSCKIFIVDPLLWRRSPWQVFNSENHVVVTVTVLIYHTHTALEIGTTVVPPVRFLHQQNDDSDHFIPSASHEPPSIVVPHYIFRLPPSLLASGGGRRFPSTHHT